MLNAYRLNEYEWWSGKTFEEAVAAAMEVTGCTRDETVDEAFGDGTPVSPSMLVWDEDHITQRPVAEILAGMTGPGFVCGTED